MVLVADAGLLNNFSFEGDIAAARGAGFEGEVALPFVNFDLTVNVDGFGGALKNNFIKLKCL